MIKADDINIISNILLLITRINEFKGAWRALGVPLPDRLLALHRVATIESVGSFTRIEGGKTA
ncbi:MAG: hypothetical protein V4536_02810 [Pseudomonadota bacterium]|jgi:hypothetical protein